VNFHRHRVAALLVFMLGCVAGIGWLINGHQRAGMAFERGQTQMRAVIGQLGVLLSGLKDAETAQRGFIITGQPNDLQPYQASLPGIAAGVADLRRLTADAPRYQQRLDAMMPLVAARLADLDQAIAVRKAQGFPAASAAMVTQSSNRIMDEIRALVEQAQAEEALILDKSVAIHQADQRRTLQSVALVSALGGLAWLLLLIRLRWEQDSKHQLRVATEAAELCIWTWQPDSDRITWENDRVYAILGWARTDAPLTAARFAAKFVHPDDLTAFRQAIADTVKNGARLFHQGRVFGADGAMRWVEFTGKPLPPTKGVPLRVIGTVQDITWRKQAEQMMARQATELITLYVKAPVGLFLFDETLRFVRVNQSTAELNGLPAEQHIGRTVREVLTPEFADVVEPQLRRVLETGQPLLNCEVHGGSALGSDEPQRYWLLSYHPVQAGDGSITGVHGVVQEITERKAADEALRQSEQRFRAMVTTTSDLMCRMSSDWSEISQIYGANLTLETAVPNRLASFVHRDDQPLLMALVHEAIQTRGVFEMEHRVRRAEGSWGWMLSRAVPLLDARGGIVEWFGAGSDVTEKKRAEQALRESERFLRSTLDALSGHIAVLDGSGTILETNAAWRRFSIENYATGAGAGAGTVRGVNDLPQREQSFSTDELAYAQEIKEVIAGRRTHFEVEYPCHSPTEKQWFVMRVSRFPSTGPVRVVIVRDNCTQQMLAAERLRESEERFRALFERGPIAIFSCDAAGMPQEFNACAVHLWGREPQRGPDYERFGGLHQLYLPDGTWLPPAQSPMAEVLDGRSEGVYDQELIIERPDGSRISIMSNTVPLKNEQGDITGGMCCFYDISERKRLERETREQAQALADRDRRKDEFLAMLSHELRNPLAAISSSAQLLGLQKNESPIQEQARSVIERQLAQLKHLVDDLMEVSRITRGSVRLRLERISVSGVVARAVETAQPLIAQRRHQLDVSLPPQAIFLQADAARLEQVLVNLLNNAAKYTDEGGRIWLSVEAEKTAGVAVPGMGDVPPMVVIRVRDTGIGIAPELLPRIFDLFTQADHSLDRSQGGLGIGLCLAQRLVELHGGTVAANSVLGQGSEFVMRLPLLLTTLPAPPTIPVSALNTAQPATKKFRVLVVDDNVDAAQSLARLLQMTGHEFALAYDGPGALQAVLQFRPDVVLMDIGLPGLSGFEVARQIRQQAALGRIVLVALTGYGQDADRQLSQEAGFDYHLVKPARFSQIENILLCVPKWAAGSTNGDAGVQGDGFQKDN